MFPYFQTEYGYGVNADCFDAFKHIADQSVDLVLCDLPYGTTQNKWDSVLPLDKLWAEYKRVCKGPIVLTAQCPFDKLLGSSNIADLKYEWIWQKSKATGHLNAKHQPLKQHENILVFCAKPSQYNAQNLIKKTTPTIRKGRDNGSNYGNSAQDALQEYENYPRSILAFASVGKTMHPTQKPVELMEYMIKTYTNEGNMVLDNTAGSMTTGVAAENLKRRWLCIEKDAEYYEAAKARFNPIGEHNGTQT